MSTQRSTLLAAAITLALSGQAAHAQQSTSSGEIEEVVVTGIRGSLRQSLETKREAVGVVDALNAEDVGKFPDKNLAEALQRVPGIVISRDFGEGERVNLRGLSSTLTRTLLNGHSLATADWFILDQLNTTRSFNYLMLPADVIGQVKVFKSPQADFEEGGIGGTIDVVTRKPLDLESMQTFLSGQMAYTDLADEYDPQFSGLFNWKNADSTFGVMVAAHLSAAEHPTRRRRGPDLRHAHRGRQPGAGARPDRLGAVHAGTRAQGRQLRIAVGSRGQPRIQRHGPVLQVRCRQHQRELPRLGLARDQQRRHADERDRAGRHGGGRHDLVAEQRHGGLRRRVRRDQSLRLGGDALDRLRLGLASGRRLGPALQGRLYRCRGQHRRAAVRRVRRAGDVHLRPARQGAAGQLRERRSDAIRTTCSSSSPRSIRS